MSPDFSTASSLTSATASLVHTASLTDLCHDPAASSEPDLRLCEPEPSIDNNLDSASSGCGSSQLPEIDEIDFKEEVRQEALENQTEKVKEKTDGLTSLIPCGNETNNSMTETKPKIKFNLEDEELKVKVVIDEDDLEDINREEATEDDSDYDSDTSESEDEFMPDGERVRKTSRGFKQISNCKRFWRASMLMG